MKTGGAVEPGDLTKYPVVVGEGVGCIVNTLGGVVGDGPGCCAKKQCGGALTTLGGDAGVWKQLGGVIGVFGEYIGGVFGGGCPQRGAPGGFGGIPPNGVKPTAVPST